METTKLIEQRNYHSPFSVYTGIQTLEISLGYAVAILEVRPEHYNGIGTVHGGCLYTLADIAAGSAVASYGGKAVTSSGEYHYLAAARNVQVIQATARTIKYGKRLVITQVELRSDANALIGEGMFTHCSIG